MDNSIYWYDYETFGTDARYDRIAQFAGIRTDEDLNIIGDPLTLYCKPANDMLPHPMASMVTGISPQKAQAEGLIEAEFINFDGNYRYALAAVDDLEKTMQESEKYYSIEITRRPLDIESDNQLSGDAGAGRSGLQARAEVGFRVVREVSADG